jgi:hypothetical protein
MRTASILLALFVMLGFVKEGGAAIQMRIDNQYAAQFAGLKFGLIDGKVYGHGSAIPFHWLCLGPLGTYEVPFTATQGLVGFIVIVAMLIITLIAAVAGWKRKRAA